MKLSQLWPWRVRSLQEELHLTDTVDSTLVTNTMLLEFLRERRGDRRWAEFKRGLFVVVILGGFCLSIFTALKMTDVIPSSQAKDYKVGTVVIRGIIGDGPGSADIIIPALRKAFEDKKTEVVLLRIDSPGGSPSEAERMYMEIDRLKAKHKKPIEAVIDNVGASAAYLIAIHTDRITAGHYSLVGSVGAIMHWWNAAEFADKVGVTQLAYASGALKDMGNPTRLPTKLEREKGLSLVSSIAVIFAQEVVTQRGNKLKIDVPTLTTGEPWSGAEALQHGLIDDIGSLESVLARYDAKGHNFGPFQHNLFGDTFAQWTHSVGAALMSGMVSEFQLQVKSQPWHAE